MEFSKTFADAKGRSWTVELTIGSARRIQDIAGIPLEVLVPPATKGKSAEAGGLEPLAELLSSPFRVYDLFYSIVKPKADELGLTKDQLEEAIDDKAAELMGLAVLKAIHDFFRWDPTRQAILREIARMGQELMGRVGRKIDEKLSSIDYGKLLDGLPEIDADKLVAEALKVSSNSPSASPDSSESIRTP